MGSDGSPACAKADETNSTLPDGVGAPCAKGMSIYNGGAQISQNIGGRLYDSFGYTPLVLISTAFTALAWVLVPMVRIDHIEAKAKRAEMPAT